MIVSWRRMAGAVTLEVGLLMTGVDHETDGRGDRSDHLQGQYCQRPRSRPISMTSERPSWWIPSSGSTRRRTNARMI